MTRYLTPTGASGPVLVTWQCDAPNCYAVYQADYAADVTPPTTPAGWYSITSTVLASVEHLCSTFCIARWARGKERARQKRWMGADMVTGDDEGMMVGWRAVNARFGPIMLHHNWTPVPRFAWPGGETSIPRALCDTAEQAGEHIGRGLHAATSYAAARAFASKASRSYILIVEAKPADVLMVTETEIRACRWRTVAVHPDGYIPFSPDPTWYHFLPNGCHGIRHAQRVLGWAWLIAGTLELLWPDDFDTEALCWAAALHDVGRQDDGPDPGHGARSAEMAREIVPARVDVQKVQYLCTWHERRDPPEWIPELLALQDADVLDLWRMTPPDIERLHTDAGKALYRHARRFAADGISLLDDPAVCVVHDS